MLASVSTVTLCNFGAQLVGVVRMIIIAAALGLTGEVDTYYLALALPSLFIVVAGNWVQFAFLGRYTTLLTDAAPDQAHTFKVLMLLLLLAFCIPVVGIFWLFPDVLMQWLVSSDKTAATAAALSFVSLMIIPVVIADFMGRTLNGHHRFALAAVAPLVNALIATLALWLWPSKDLTALVGSLLIGSVVQLLLVAPSFLKLGASRRLQLQISRFELTQVVQITAWVIPAMLLGNAMLSIMQFSVSRLGEGAVAMMGYANRINAGLAQLLVIGLGTVLLPLFAQLVAERQYTEIQSIFRKLMRGTVIVCSTVCLGTYLFGTDIVALLFARGEFTYADAQAVALLLWVLTLSLLPLSIGSFIARYFNSLRRGDLLFGSSLVGIVGVLVGTGLGLYFGNILLVGLAPLICYFMTAVYWLAQLRHEIAVRPVLQDLAAAVPRALLLLLPALVCDQILLFIVPIDGHFLFALRVASFAAIFLAIGYVAGYLRWVLHVES